MLRSVARRLGLSLAVVSRAQLTSGQRAQMRVRDESGRRLLSRRDSPLVTRCRRRPDRWRFLKRDTCLQEAAKRPGAAAATLIVCF